MAGRHALPMINGLISRRSSSVRVRAEDDAPLRASLRRIPAELQLRVAARPLAPVERVGFAHLPTPTSHVLEAAYYPNWEVVGAAIHRTLERSEREAVVRRALEALGERDREALLLWDAGLDYGEIAGALEISTGSVGTTLARARERLVKAHREQERDDVAHQ